MTERFDLRKLDDQQLTELQMRGLSREALEQDIRLSLMAAGLLEIRIKRKNDPDCWLPCEPDDDAWRI